MFAWTEADFCSVFNCLNLSIARSRRLNGNCESSTLLLAQRPVTVAELGHGRHSLTVSWQMSIPRSNSRSYTFRSDSGKPTYISTTSRITSGEELK